MVIVHAREVAVGCGNAAGLQDRVGGVDVIAVQDHRSNLLKRVPYRAVAGHAAGPESLALLK